MIPTDNTCDISAPEDRESCPLQDEQPQQNNLKINFEGMWQTYLKASFLPERTGDGVCAVYPAVGVDHVLRYIIGVDTVYGVAHVLRG